MSITAKDIQTLRQDTGTGMMDAKRALVEADGDLERAKEILREKGIAAAAKRTGRAQTQGSIGSYLHMQAGRPVIGVLVELASETDFVAKGEEFQRAANDIAMHVAAAAPRWPAARRRASSSAMSRGSPCSRSSGRPDWSIHGDSRRARRARRRSCFRGHPPSRSSWLCRLGTHTPTPPPSADGKSYPPCY